MIERFQKIHKEYGIGNLLRTFLLLFGMIIMSIFGWLYFYRIEILIVPIFLSLLGLIFRNKIANIACHMSKIVKGTLFIYGIVLFLGDRVGIPNYWKLFIITIATALVFNLQFWSLSDPDVCRIHDGTDSES